MAIGEPWEQRGSGNSKEERLANSLGWFSIGLGLAEVAAPGMIAELIGIGEESRSRALLRMYGLREIAAGIGILSQARPAGWMWGRVAGDVLDLASLGSALASGDAKQTRVGAATAAVLGVTALDVLCARELSREAGQEGREPEQEEPKSQGAVHVRRTIIINRSPQDVYGFWRNFNNLATFMKHLESVEMRGENRSHWKAKAPAGKTVEWDAEIVEDQPNSRIAWRSLEGSDIDNSGSVRFERAPGGWGTLVRVEMQYSPPGGAIGARVAKLFRSEPGQQIEDDLRALKQVMETGEIAKSDASIHSGMHPGQPSARAATA